LSYIFQDFSANQNNIKARLVVLLFRIGDRAAKSKKSNLLLWLLFVPYFIFYRVCIEWVLCIEIPLKTIIGSGLKIFHGQGIVINDHCIIGNNITLRNGVTIGNIIDHDGVSSRCPVIGDDVEFGANSVVIGPVIIGNGAKIGAGAVVTKNVTEFSTVVGVPARKI